MAWCPDCGSPAGPTGRKILNRVVYGCGNSGCDLEYFHIDGELVKLYGPAPEGWWGKRNFDTTATNHYWPSDKFKMTLCGIHGTPGRETGAGMCRECQKRGAPAWKKCEGCGIPMKATGGRLCHHCSEMADSAAEEAMASTYW